MAHSLRRYPFAAFQIGCLFNLVTPLPRPLLSTPHTAQRAMPIYNFTSESQHRLLVLSLYHNISVDDISPIIAYEGLWGDSSADDDARPQYFNETFHATQQLVSCVHCSVLLLLTFAHKRAQQQRCPSTVLRFICLVPSESTTQVIETLLCLREFTLALRSLSFLERIYDHSRRTFNFKRWPI